MCQHNCIVNITNMKTISDRLKHVRGLKAWTQAQLAVASGVSTGTIGNIESGARQSKGSLPQIADALGVRHKWLAYGEGQMWLASGAVSRPTALEGATQSAREREPTYPITPRASDMARTIATLFDAMPDPQKKRKAFALCVLMMQEDQWPQPVAHHEAPKQTNGTDA